MKNGIYGRWKDVLFHHLQLQFVVTLKIEKKKIIKKPNCIDPRSKSFIEEKVTKISMHFRTSQFTNCETPQHNQSKLNQKQEITSIFFPSYKLLWYNNVAMWCFIILQYQKLNAQYQDIQRRNKTTRKKRPYKLNETRK